MLGASEDQDVPAGARVLRWRADVVTLRAVPGDLHEYTVYAHELDRFQRTADFLAARLGAR